MENQIQFNRLELDFSLLVLLMATGKEVITLEWTEDAFNGLFKNEHSFLRSLQNLHNRKYVYSYFGPDKKIFAMPTSKAIKMFEPYSQTQIICSIRDLPETDIGTSAYAEFLTDIQSK